MKSSRVVMVGLVSVAVVLVVLSAYLAGKTEEQNDVLSSRTTFAATPSQSQVSNRQPAVANLQLAYRLLADKREDGLKDCAHKKYCYPAFVCGNSKPYLGEYDHGYISLYILEPDKAALIVDTGGWRTEFIDHGHKGIVDTVVHRHKSGTHTGSDGSLGVDDAVDLVASPGPNSQRLYLEAVDEANSCFTRRLAQGPLTHVASAPNF